MTEAAGAGFAAVSAGEFRSSGSSLAAAVNIVTATVGDQLNGCTATAVATLSLDPPLILVCLDRTSRTLPRLVQAGAFAVNVMRFSSRAEHLSRRFAGKGNAKFSDVAYHKAVTGAPVIEDALAWFDCELVCVLEGGDHRILIGRVLATQTNEGDPLMYWKGTFRQLPSSKSSLHGAPPTLPG